MQEKTASTGVSQSEIDAAVKEYQERKKAKADKEGAVDEKEASGNDTKIAVSEKKDLDKKSKPSSSQPTSPAPPEPTHYQLHKSFFDMRVRLHQQKTHLKDAQSRRSQLVFPAAPSAQPGIGQSSLAAK